MTQRMIEITSPNFLPETELPETINSPALFGNSNPLALEIGCGIGDFMVQLARQNPGTNFLAIDIYNKGCHKTCQRIDQAGLDNVRVLRMEARYLLVKHFEKQSLAAVYINCPDPWPKKRHRRRRLVGQEFLELVRYFLVPGGDLYFSTDFVDYAEQVAEALPCVAGFHNCLEAPLVHDLPGYPLSKYMHRFLQLGQPIHFIHYRRQTDFTCPELPPEVTRGFRVRWSQAENE